MIQPKYSDKQWIVDTLTEAFIDNLSVKFVVKQDQKRDQRLRYLMDYSFEVCWNWGEVYVTEDKKGVVLFVLPHKKKNIFKAATLDIKLALKTVGLKQTFKVLSRESMIKKHHPKHPFYYLWFIGISPESQGKGFGSKLMEEIVAESEKRNYPIYLETSTLRNLPFYKKFQFETYHKADFGFTLFMMKREPLN
jgi:ribosomal protein S18 acetylase RimI-like enzyme